ncbi:MAG: hypothetical protein ACOH1J_02520 [Microbacteriaceae bacterium]
MTQAPAPMSSGNRMVVSGIDRLLTVQRPVVLAHLRSIRASRPNASPEDVIRIVERRYLTAVTSGGALVGASAVIPAVGVGASLALSAAETGGFLEASALFAQSVTEVHGIAIEDPDRARTLVMTLILGTAGTDLLKQLAAQASGTGAGRGQFWGEMVTKNLSSTMVNQVADQMKKTFMKRFSVTQGTNILGRAIPFGIGAVIGGTGNHLLGRQIVRGSREAFPPPPREFPEILTPSVRVKQPKALREKKQSRAKKVGPKKIRAKKQLALEVAQPAQPAQPEPPANN